MAQVYKCKMCGATLNIKDGDTIAVCEYCGTTQTLPRLDSERKANLYDRANHFRRNNEYDKAMSIYEQILSEDKTDAESYWSIALCRYGVEYVEDPSSHKMIPTINRTQFISILNDEDYLLALEHADDRQKKIYEQQAKDIDEIQKGILEISNKEEPYDVFICYKETDNNGRRTQDSVIAQDIFKELSNEGYKVFFSRITLENHLGQEYEPYIFNALNTARVMLVVGTKKEYFDSVWVKNEWSRYLSLINVSSKRTLIPCYRDMDPYDLPEEFSHLQAQDLSKIGFIQDLVHGIEKLIGVKKISSIKITGAEDNIQSLFKRAEMFLEEGDKTSAYNQYDKVLDIDPENGKAYLMKLLYDLNVNDIESLKNLRKAFDDNENYKRVIKYADKSTVDTLVNYNNIAIKNHEDDLERDRIDKEKREEEKRQIKLENAKKRAIVLKRTIIIFAVLALIGFGVFAYFNIYIPSKGYSEAIAIFENKEYDKAKQMFDELNGYKDSSGMSLNCDYQKALLKVNGKANSDAITDIVNVSLSEDNSSKAKEVRYNAAIKLEELDCYRNALYAFQALSGYKDSKDHYNYNLIEISKAEFDEEEYYKALYNMNEVAKSKYPGGKELFESMIDSIYEVAIGYCEDFSFDNARYYFDYIVEYRTIDVEKIINEYIEKKNNIFSQVLGTWVSNDTKDYPNNNSYLEFNSNNTFYAFSYENSSISGYFSYDSTDKSFVLKHGNSITWKAYLNDGKITLSWGEGYDSYTSGIAGKNYTDAHYEKVVFGTTRDFSKKQITMKDDDYAELSINNWSYHNAGPVRKYDIYDVYDIYKDGTTSYYKVLTVEGKYGWVNSEHALELHRLKVTNEYINIRSGPSTDYEILGKVYENEEYDIYDVKYDYPNEWYKIKFGENEYGYLGDKSSLELIDDWN